MVQSVPSLARSLGVEVVAQGVETKADLQVLRQLGYAAMQGYYFASHAGHPIQVACSLTEGVGVRKQVSPATLRGIDELWPSEAPFWPRAKAHHRLHCNSLRQRPLSDSYPLLGMS